MSLPNISSITLPADTSMLAALPAHSLTHLDLKLGLTASVDSQAAATALARLSNLQQLRLGAYRQGRNPDPKRISYSCLAGVGQLSRLTLLDLDGAHLGDSQHVMQLLAQQLPLRVLRLSMHFGLPLLDMSHLTQLQEFSESSHSREGLHAIFPPQLQRLELGRVSSQAQFEALMPLHQLRCLKFSVVKEPGDAGLGQLPALQQLTLGFYVWHAAAAAAATWPQLPQLRELTVYCYDADPNVPGRQQWEAILNGVAASTNLTKLILCTPDGDAANIGAEGEGGGQPITLFAKLAGLVNLKHLDMWSRARHSPGEALALTALTGLTRLDLPCMGDAVGDLAACAIAGSCTQLQHLGLSKCDLRSMVCLAAVRHLTQLTELRLNVNNMRLTQQGLMSLTGLKRLQDLGVDKNAEVTGEVVESFWAAVRRQQQ